MSYGFKIMAEGDYACFTRPEMKVERVSYDVPTPGALEGMLKSVYWKPPIRYCIDKIYVFNPIKFLNIRRNEVKDKASLSKVQKAMKDKSVFPGILINSDTIKQKSAMILKDVKYGIEFHFELTGLKCDNEENSEEKHYNIILRRLEKGQYFRKPCFGCREFSVNSMKLVDEFPIDEISPELKGDKDLGFMLYKMNYKDNDKPINNDWKNPVFSDKADPMFYHPHMIDGMIDVSLYRRDLKC